jgi:hypothetical protein
LPDCTGVEPAEELRALREAVTSLTREPVARIAPGSDGPGWA